MNINEQLEDGILILHISDQINSTTAPILGEKLDAKIAEGHAHLVLDLSKVPYVGSAGLRVLSIALRAVRAAQASGDLYLTNLSDTVAYTFRISGFDQLFCIYDTVAEGLAAMAASREMDWVD
jgi:stage II sporulation protein AA (anti-sigma F factor antagonist)